MKVFFVVAVEVFSISWLAPRANRGFEEFTCLFRCCAYLRGPQKFSCILHPHPPNDKCAHCSVVLCLGRNFMTGGSGHDSGEGMNIWRRPTRREYPRLCAAQG